MKPEPRIESLTGDLSQTITRSILLLGRHPESDLQLNHPCVSRRHCCIVEHDRYLSIVDLGSRHGVWVNGKRITAEQLLKHGDQFAVGTFYFRVLLGAEEPLELDNRPEQTYLTDLNTVIPQAADDALNLDIEENLPQPEVEISLIASQQSIEATQQLQPVDAISIEKSHDLLDGLEIIDAENTDSGYEPVFDLKL